MHKAAILYESHNHIKHIQHYTYIAAVSYAFAAGHAERAAEGNAHRHLALLYAN